MPVTFVKFFQKAVMTQSVGEVLHEAFAYCQVTFDLPPLGGAVPKREVSDVRSELTRRKKVC